MGAPRRGRLTAVVVLLLVLGALAPVTLVSAAIDMFPDTVYRGSLDSANPREDYNLTANAGTRLNQSTAARIPSIRREVEITRRTTSAILSLPGPSCCSKPGPGRRHGSARACSFASQASFR